MTLYEDIFIQGILVGITFLLISYCLFKSIQIEFKKYIKNKCPKNHLSVKRFENYYIIKGGHNRYAAYKIDDIIPLNKKDIKKLKGEL